MKNWLGILNKTLFSLFMMGIKALEDKHLNINLTQESQEEYEAQKPRPPKLWNARQVGVPCAGCGYALNTTFLYSTPSNDDIKIRSQNP